MLDVIIAGAGPAGSIAALIAARAGARVLIVDRDTFPRDKLCGDTLNPGAIALLQSLGLDDGPLAGACRLAGMVVTGRERSLEARYGGGVHGVAIQRRTLDEWLLNQAIAAGARFEPGLIVRSPLLGTSPGVPIVRGLVLAKRGDARSQMRLPANMTIAADGRGSTLARSLGLVSHPTRARRWAFGVYATGVAGVTDVGEMHIRAGAYLGIAPLGGGLFNVCAVTGPRPEGPAPLDVVRRAIARDPAIAARFEHVAFQTPVRVLGPLAVEARAVGVPGLLLAGDAAGFIDPMTGDGLHLAMRGAVLAAREALTALEHGDLAGAVGRLELARHAALARKQRFNRWLRRLVDSPVALDVAAFSSRITPGLIRWAIRYAGDAA